MPRIQIARDRERGNRTIERARSAKGIRSRRWDNPVTNGVLGAVQAALEWRIGIQRQHLISYYVVSDLSPTLETKRVIEEKNVAAPASVMAHNWRLCRDFGTACCTGRVRSGGRSPNSAGMSRAIFFDKTSRAKADRSISKCQYPGQAFFSFRSPCSSQTPLSASALERAAIH